MLTFRHRPARYGPLESRFAGAMLAFLFALGAFAALGWAAPLHAQDATEQRLASIVAVAVDEYGKAIDARGVLVSRAEYDEATTFFDDARKVAGTLHGSTAAAATATLDTMMQAVAQRRPPAALDELHAHFIEALGTAGRVELPSAPLDTAIGHQLFAGNCASCHGAAGLGNGPVAHALSTAVPAIGSASAVPDLDPLVAYSVVSVGVRNTPMPAFATTLTPEQRWQVLNYVYALRGQPGAIPIRATASPTDEASRATLALLDSALTFARHGDRAAAGDRAFDAYLAFEPLEGPARAHDPGLVSGLERTFAEFKGALRRGDVDRAAAARDAIAQGLPRVIALNAGGETSGWTAFWESFLIILREGFEAILVIGAVVAFLIKTGNRNRLRSIWYGVVLALLASAVTAIVIKTIFAAIPASSEVIEAVSLLIAVVVLFSVSYWLISKVEAAKWQHFIRTKVTRALERGGGGALALVAFLAVYREGAETALFYQALFSRNGDVALPLSLGIALGFVVLAVIFVLFYRFGVRIPMRLFFTVTGVLLYAMAFVFAGRGIRELQEGNVLPITLVPHVPHIDALGIFPTVETLSVQLVLLALFVYGVMRTLLRPHRDAGAA